MSLHAHFLLAALRMPVDLTDRPHSIEETRFHAIARAKIQSDPEVRLVTKMNNALILSAATEQPLIRKRNAFSLHGYFVVGGDRKWYEETQKLLIAKIAAPPEWLSCHNQ